MKRVSSSSSSSTTGSVQPSPTPPPTEEPPRTVVEPSHRVKENSALSSDIPFLPSSFGIGVDITGKTIALRNRAKIKVPDRFKHPVTSILRKARQVSSCGGCGGGISAKINAMTTNSSVETFKSTIVTPHGRHVFNAAYKDKTDDNPDVREGSIGATLFVRSTSLFADIPPSLPAELTGPEPTETIDVVRPKGSVVPATEPCTAATTAVAVVKTLPIIRRKDRKKKKRVYVTSDHLGLTGEEWIHSSPGVRKVYRVCIKCGQDGYLSKEYGMYIGNRYIPMRSCEIHDEKVHGAGGGDCIPKAVDLPMKDDDDDDQEMSDAELALFEELNDEAAQIRSKIVPPSIVVTPPSPPPPPLITTVIVEPCKHHYTEWKWRRTVCRNPDCNMRKCPGCTEGWYPPYAKSAGVCEKCIAKATQKAREKVASKTMIPAAAAAEAAAATTTTNPPLVSTSKDPEKKKRIESIVQRAREKSALRASGGTAGPKGRAPTIITVPFKLTTTTDIITDGPYTTEKTRDETSEPLLEPRVAQTLETAAAETTTKTTSPHRLDDMDRKFLESLTRGQMRDFVDYVSFLITPKEISVCPNPRKPNAGMHFPMLGEGVKYCKSCGSKIAPFVEWGVDDICMWLLTCGENDVAIKFKQEYIDGDFLMDASLYDLRAKLGVPQATSAAILTSVRNFKKWYPLSDPNNPKNPPVDPPPGTTPTTTTATTKKPDNVTFDSLLESLIL